MSSDNSDWRPEQSEQSIRALIRAAVTAIGVDEADTLPFKVRERLKGQISGDLDIDLYVREILKEMKGRHP